MPIEDLVKQVAGTLERDSGVRAVFGPSIELQHHVIVPVAVVSGGAAGGGSPGDEGHFTGGMGVGLNVRPVGFIYESGDQVLFTPIHVDERKRSIFTEAANGVRRVFDLAYSVITQFVQSTGPQVPTPSRMQQGDGAQVSSPS